MERVLTYDHKHIVKCVEGFIQVMFIERYVTIMEYCDGGDLEDFIKLHGGQKELMPLYLRMFSEMTEAIAYMHNMKSKHMHRDLKPQNVLLMFPPGT